MERLLLLDPDNTSCFDNATFTEVAVDVEDIHDFHKHLKCDIVDVARRRVGDTVYDIWCDDEGLLVEKPIISAVRYDDGVLEPMLVGRLLFAKHDGMGGTIGLTDKDIMNIKGHCGVCNSASGAVSVAVMCDYDI